MGLTSKNHYRTSAKIIVILEWQNEPQRASPRRQFWLLEQPEDGASKAAALPLPESVNDRFGESARPPFANAAAQDQAQDDGESLQTSNHLPPLLIHGLRFNILMHTLSVDRGVSAERMAFGPGIRMNQTQAMGKLFDGGPETNSDPGMLSSPAAAIVSSSWKFRSEDEDETKVPSSALFIAMATANGDGSANVKYCVRRMGQPLHPSPKASEVHGTHEQTLRVAFESERQAPAAEEPLKPSAPVHMCSIGSSPQYLVIMTVCPNTDNKKGVLTLHAMRESMAFSEASSMSQPDEDRGFRWQAQTFNVSANVARMAATIVYADHTTYLILFYFEQGALRYDRFTYVGSGSFADLSHDNHCIVEPSEVDSPGPNRSAPRSASYSLKSLSSYMSLSSRDQDAERRGVPEPKRARQEEEPDNTSSVLAAEGCQPYSVLANGYIWIFFEDQTGNGRYMRHKTPGKEIRDLGDGWETASWDTRHGVHNSEGSSTHFIPVVMPGNFMHMT